MSLRKFTTTANRRKFMEETLHTSLDAIGMAAITDETNIHCENLIGATTIPLGVAGPLKIQEKKENIYIPLATTEGALVASVNRGCKAIFESGGVTVYCEKVGATRGPVFYTGTIAKSRELKEFITKNSHEFNEQAKKVSTHLTLLHTEVKMLADYVFVRFLYDTTDAMGMNMVTFATTQIAEYIERKTGISCLSVAGNYDVDKKPSFLNTIEGRGIQVWAEATIAKDVVSSVLKTTPQKIYDVWLAKNMLGSAVSGSLGFNAHVANVVAAIFLATGQDPAHVVEASQGITTAKVLENGELYLSLFLPALMIGTVGGGTVLPTQQEALSLLGVAGNGTVMKFAQIIGGAVLAGELSLLASLASNTLACAHENLGRKSS